MSFSVFKTLTNAHIICVLIPLDYTGKSLGKGLLLYQACYLYLQWRFEQTSLSSCIVEVLMLTVVNIRLHISVVFYSDL